MTGRRSLTESLAALSRGGETSSHRITILMINIFRLIGIGAVLFSITATASVMWLVSDQNREIWMRYQEGRALRMMLMHDSIVKIRIGDKQIPVRAAQVERALAKYYPKAKQAVSRAMILPAGLSVGALVLVLGWLYRQGVDESEDAFIRGQQLVPIEKVRKRAESEDPSPIVFGGLPIPKRLLYRNCLAIGSMGTGKSQALIGTMNSLRDAGVKTVVYDPTGEFASAYYREGKDVILNPVDARCAPWSVADDVRTSTDPSLIATAFVPDDPRAGSHKFWNDSARTLLEDMLRIAKRDRLTMAQLSLIMGSATAQQLEKLLRTHKAKSVSLVSGGTGNTTQSIRAQLTSNSALRYLDLFPTPTPENPAFSVRNWTATDDDSWLFLTSKSDIHDSIKPYIAVFLSLALTQAMDVPRDTLRLAFVIDELESAGKLDALNIALTQARKFGILTLIGVQSFAQIVKVYGPETAATFMGNLQNKLILRVEEADAAKKFADFLGKEEVHEVQKGVSYGVADESDASTITRQRKDRYVVHPSEIVTLPDLTGYIKLAGQYPVARVTFEYQKLPQNSPPLMRRDMQFT